MKKPSVAVRASDSYEISTRRKKSPPETRELSPERISEGVSTKTEVLTRILEQEQTHYHFRHWGINE